MAQRASGLEGNDGPGSPPRSAAGNAGGSAQQTQAGRGPVLDAAQLEVLRRYGSEHDVAAGEVLFADGDVSYDLIVLLAGQVRIIERFGQPGQAVVATYGPSQFLGEIGLLTGQRAYLSAVASTAGRVLRVPVLQVRVLMAQELGLSELILRTFLLRHSILTGLRSGLTLIGSRFDTGTRRLLEVLARNRLPSRWLELEGSPEAEAMLRDLDVPVTDLPIVVVPGGPLLRNPSSHELLDALGMSGASDTDLPGACDLLVVGAGPGGLAAAVYGASEGMATILAEDTALGGQAGTSSRIENLLGFPAGLSGEELSRSSAEVHIIIRGQTLDTSMSRYLIDQIERDPRITVTPGRRSPHCSARISSKACSCSTTAASGRQLWPSGACSCLSAHSPLPGGWRASSPKTTGGSCLPALASRKPSSTTPARCRCSWKPAGRGSSPSATSAAGQSSGRRPQSGRARWQCGWCSSGSRPQGAQSRIHPAPTELGAEPTSAGATPAGSRQRAHRRVPRAKGALDQTNGTDRAFDHKWW